MVQLGSGMGVGLVQEYLLDDTGAIPKKARVLSGKRKSNMD